MFGETLSISTAFWSSNTLVCLLPPSAVPGIVPVSFFNHHLLHNKSSLLTDTKSSSSTTTPPAAYFTYKSPSETCILELALQVINLRLTGVLDDAQQIAMRIVNSSPSTTAPSSNGGGGVGNVESSIVQMLNQLDLKSSQTSSETVMAVAETDILLTTRSASSGHTLAHYACILGMPLLLQNLIDKSRSFGSRNNMLESDYDLNGYTSMHLAVLFGHMDCILCLLKGKKKR